jgi:hypothetical protein
LPDRGEGVNRRDLSPRTKLRLAPPSRAGSRSRRREGERRAGAFALTARPKRPRDAGVVSPI